MKSPRLLATTLALAAGVVAAETSPWYVGVAQGFTHTDNVRLVPDGQPRDGSTVAVTTLLGGLDQPIGRQRLFGSASLRHLDYSGASDLNNQGYDLSLGLDWSTVERVSGRVQAQASRRLDQATILDRNTLTLVGAKNLQKAESFSALVRVGTVTPLTMEASLGWRRQDMSLAELGSQDYDSSSFSAGLRYRFSGALTAGAALRHTEYDYPRWSATESNRVKRDDLDLSATWVASGASTLNARLSLGESRHSAGSQQGFSGATGSLAWDWRPTGKLKLDTQLQRDTGVESDVAYRSGPASVVLADDSRLTTSLALRLTYEVSAKVKATASVREARRDLERATVQGKDRQRNLAVGVTWQPTRSVQVGCDASRDRRSSSNAAVSQPYGVTTYGCQVQLVLQ